MTSTCFRLIAKRLAELSNHVHLNFGFGLDFQNIIDFKEDTEDFSNALTEICQRIDLALLRNDIPANKLLKLLEVSGIPVFTFLQENNVVLPAIFYQTEDGEWLGYLYRDSQEEKISDIMPYLEKLYLKDKKKNDIVYFTPFPLTPLVSETEPDKASGTPTPVERLFRLLALEKRDIMYVYFYAFIIALISLTLPLGIQSMMELVSGGVIFNSIILLISFIIIGILAAGVLQILQYTIVEVIERRIFVKAAMEFGYRIPRVRTEALANYYAPELMNRFFDVLTLQKGLPKFLIDLAGSVLQIVFGLILLSFYHPFFVFFGLSVMFALVLVVYFTGPSGLRASIVESKYKYKVAHWLEELARTLEAFKMAGHTSLPLSKMEYLVNNYLYYRKKHFKVLMIQFSNIIGFKTVVTGGLLIIGSALVIDRQITLGQFVASEIIIILILNAIEKLISSLSTIFDMLTAVDKIGYVTDLQLERKSGIFFPKEMSSSISLKIRNLKYRYTNATEYTLKGIDLDVQAGEHVCIAGFNQAGKNTFAHVIGGLLESYEGSVAINNISLREISLPSLRDVVAYNFSTEDIFEGSVLDNIQMGRSNVSYQDVTWAVDSMGLTDFIHSLPDGLQTELIAGAKSFSSSILTKLTIARCIAEKPKLLILNDFLHSLEREERLRILQFLMDKKNPWTLLCVSNDPTLLTTCDRIVLMKGGLITANGTYEELLYNKDFQKILISPKDLIK